MRKFIHIKLITRLILMAVLTVSVNCLAGNAHAMDCNLSTACNNALCEDIFAVDHCPCSPDEQHKDTGGCDTCINCICHAPMTIKPLLISYKPSMLDIHTSNPFMFFPEVYLPKFIPPQNLV